MGKRNNKIFGNFSQRLRTVVGAALGERQLWLPAAALIAVSGGAMAFAIQDQNAPSAFANKSAAPGARADRAVSAERLQRKNDFRIAASGLQDSVTTTGVVKPGLLVKVGTQLSGTVAEILVDFNDPVRKGQALARLAPELFEAAAREARATLAVARATARLRATAIERASARAMTARSELSITEARLLRTRAEHARARRDLNRKTPLAERGRLPKSELDRVRTATTVSAATMKETEAELQSRKAAVAAAEAERRMATVDHQVARATISQRQAALERAEVNLERTVIRSPLDGIVVARKVDVGQTVAASLNAPTLFTVARDLRQMEVHANVDEADIGQIRVRQPVTFTVDAYPNRNFRGTVSQIRKSPTVIQNVISYTVVIAADNRDKTLMPGMTTLVRIDTGKKSAVRRTQRRQ
jgi:HlyD family secretion protein